MLYVFTCAMLISLMISTRVSPIFSRARFARSASSESFLALDLVGLSHCHLFLT